MSFTGLNDDSEMQLHLKTDWNNTNPFVKTQR